MTGIIFSYGSGWDGECETNSVENEIKNLIHMTSLWTCCEHNEWLLKRFLH